MKPTTIHDLCPCPKRRKALPEHWRQMENLAAIDRLLSVPKDQWGKLDHSEYQTPERMAAVFPLPKYQMEHLSESARQARLAVWDQLVGSIDRRLRERFREAEAEFRRSLAVTDC